MAIQRGALATLKVRLRAGLQNELGLQVVVNEDEQGRVVRQQVTVNYDTALLEVLKTFLDDMATADTNTTFRTRLTALRTALDL